MALDGKKATKDGRYVHNGAIFKTKAGSIIPPGAVFYPEGATIPKLNPGNRKRRESAEDAAAQGRQVNTSREGGNRERRDRSGGQGGGSGQTGGTGDAGGEGGGPPEPPK